MIKEQSELLDQLYRDNYQSVLRICMFYVGNDRQLLPMVEDCVQDAFVSAVLHFDELKEYKNPMGWIVKAALNRLNNELSKRKRRSHVVSFVDEDALNNIASHMDTEEMLQQKLLREEIGLFYQNLADKDKTVFLDYFIKKMRAKDISISEGVTQESVRSRIKRIRKLAREMIDHTWIMKLLHWLWRLSPVKKEGGR
jgi:RNA polymerase sigma factor (sigma-70 family)